MLIGREMCSYNEAPKVHRGHTQQLYRLTVQRSTEQLQTETWANAQRDGRPAEYRWRPLFNAAKFG